MVIVSGTATSKDIYIREPLVPKFGASYLEPLKPQLPGASYLSHVASLCYMSFILLASLVHSYVSCTCTIPSPEKGYSKYLLTE